MDEFKVIVVMNEAMLRTRKENSENLKIKEYLKDEAIFFKINQSDAYKILEKVGVRRESMENVYKKLIAPAIFYDLLNKGKISADDNNLIIKYEIGYKDIFKKTDNN